MRSFDSSFTSCSPLGSGAIDADAPRVMSSFIDDSTGAAAAIDAARLRPPRLLLRRRPLGLGRRLLFGAHLSRLVENEFVA